MATNTRSPYNNENELFKRLTRLFSGPIVNLKAQNYRDLKRKQLDRYKFKSASGKSFKRAEYNPFESIQLAQLSNQNRTSRYIDYDQMEFEPIISAAMNLYADEITFSTEMQEIIRIECANAEIKSTLHSLFYDILNIEQNAFGWVRNTIKYGDFFLYVDIDDVTGIRNVVGLPAHEIERLEGEDPTNPNYIQFQWNSGGLTLENWQMAHFRLLGNDKMAPYGVSALEPARRIWRQLMLLEDYMLAYRIVRSSSRRVFYLDVGHISENDVEQHVLNVQAMMKKNQVLDSSNGRMDLRYNPYYAVENDFFIPVRGDSKTNITDLPGSTYNGGIDDVKYLKDKLFAALQIPQSYLFRGEGSSEDKTTLAQKDVMFARTVQRIQKNIVAELYKLAVTHLYVLGFRDLKDLTGYTLSFNNPSRIAELQELEYYKTKFDVGSAAVDSLFSKRWVSQNIFHISEEEFERNQRERFYDAKIEAAIASISEGEESGGGGMGGGSDLFGGLDDSGEGGEIEDIADDVMGDMGSADGGAETGPDEDSMLLAAPAKRDETTTPKSKGKMYQPEVNDKRTLGARARNLKSQWGGSSSVNTARNVLKGYSDLKGLSRGIAENQDTIYHREESALLKTSLDTKRLIEGLEKRTKKNENQTAQ